MEAQGRLWEKTAINENKHRATMFVSGSMRFYVIGNFSSGLCYDLSPKLYLFTTAVIIGFPSRSSSGVMPPA